MGKYTAALPDLVAGAPNGYFSILFCRTLVTVDALIKNLYMQNGIMTNGGSLQSDHYDPVTGKGWLIKYNGEAFFYSGKIGGVDIDARSILVDGKGYLPIGFVYFQLRDQPEPAALFTGTWENISSQYAGLFFRVEGGNAISFGNNQDMMIQNHRHSSFIAHGNIVGNEGIAQALTFTTNDYTGYAGGIETRPVNTTIKVWKRTA
jgi:hypothetical protein